MNNDILLEALKKIAYNKFPDQDKAQKMRIAAHEAIKKWEDSSGKEVGELQEAINGMDKRTNALYLELPELVADDVKKAWTNVKYLLQSVPPYKKTGMRGWRKYIDLPKEAGFYVCECQKKGNGETSQTVTYGQYIVGFPFIKVDEEKYGKVVLWLDESVPPYKEEGWKILIQKINDRCWDIHNDTSPETKIKFDAYIEIRDLVYEFFTYQP